MLCGITPLMPHRSLVRILIAALTLGSVALLFPGVAARAGTLQVGFNQAWFQDHYGTQYLDGVYDEAEVVRIFKLTRSSGARELRLWFFESLDFPMLEWMGNRISGPRPDFVKNVIRMMRLAKAEGISIYMTLLDAQVYRPDRVPARDRARFQYLLTRAGFQEFLSRAVVPLFQAIRDAGLEGVISKVDLMNEGDAAVDRFAFGWKDASRFLCQGRSALRQVPGYENVPVTFSVRLSRVLPLPPGFLEARGAMACADFLDFHSYSNEGGIASCAWVKRYADQKIRPVILGEFGQSYFNHRFDDSLQVENTRAYLRSAEACGFSAALAWRLSDIRPGVNPEARYSFETDSGVRPAFEVIRQDLERGGI